MSKMIYISGGVFRKRDTAGNFSPGESGCVYPAQSKVSGYFLVHEDEAARVQVGDLVNDPGHAGQSESIDANIDDDRPGKRARLTREDGSTYLADREIVWMGNRIVALDYYRVTAKSGVLKMGEDRGHYDDDAVDNQSGFMRERIDVVSVVRLYIDAVPAKSYRKVRPERATPPSPLGKYVSGRWVPAA